MSVVYHKQRLHSKICGQPCGQCPYIVKAGATVLVAGNSVFKAKEGISRAIRRLREATA